MNNSWGPSSVGYFQIHSCFSLSNLGSNKTNIHLIFYAKIKIHSLKKIKYSESFWRLFLGMVISSKNPSVTNKQRHIIYAASFKLCWHIIIAWSFLLPRTDSWSQDLIFPTNIWSTKGLKTKMRNLTLVWCPESPKERKHMVILVGWKYRLNSHKFFTHSEFSGSSYLETWNFLLFQQYPRELYTNLHFEQPDEK